MTSDPDPIETHIYGPAGWTLPMVVQLRPWLIGEEHNGVRDFVGVPIETGELIEAMLAHSADSGVEGFRVADFVAAARTLGPGAQIAGRAISQSRGDERVEFTGAYPAGTFPVVLRSKNDLALERALTKLARQTPQELEETMLIAEAEGHMLREERADEAAARKAKRRRDMN